MTPQEFHTGVTDLINRLCDDHAWDPLRILLSAYPMHMGLTDDWGEIVRALKSVRVEGRGTLDRAQMDLVVDLQHFAEFVLERHSRGADT